MAIV